MKTYIKQSINLIKVFLIGVLIFSIARLVYLIRFDSNDLSSTHLQDLIKSFVVGIRFDIQILCYVFALSFLLNFLHFFKNEKLTRSIIKFNKIFLTIILSLLSLLLILDQQFYTYFQAHFNINVFAFIEDDTTAILASMWSDHPVIIIFLIVTILSFVLFKILNFIFSKPINIKKNTPIYLNIGGIIIFILLFALGTRGSFGLFPLNMEDSTVSENAFINNLTLNGIFTFEKAIEEFQKQKIELTKSQILKKHGYSDIMNVLENYYIHENDSLDINRNYLDYVFQKTDTNSFLKKNPPNVVFILMESFGGYYLDFHNENFNLLGSLEPHLEDGIHFSNFLSSTRGTIYSLENILINRDMPILSGTPRRFEQFKSSVAYPYSKAGYQTVFITGGKLGWRNLHELVPNQFYDESYGLSAILKNNKKASTNTWGVYDEFLFDDIFDKLSSNKNKAKMIFALSTTNHTPYEIPSSYAPYKLEMSDSIKDMIFCNEKIAQLNFTAFQYSNNCLGNFLTKLKASEFGENTIVAITGDHNSYAVFPYLNKEIGERNNHKVPFMLFIPEKYKSELHVNTERYGSHKDIFPTLINLSLSNSEYFTLGNNLFNKNKADSLFYGINGIYNFCDTTLSQQTLLKKVNARSIINKYYFATE